jgi:hypothetical protein
VDRKLGVVTFDEWLQVGMDEGWCGPPVCATHDGVPTTVVEDDEISDDPCLHVIRLYEDADTKAAVEANHPPSVWRATNRA